MFDYYVHFIIQLCVLNNKNDVIHCDITVDMALFVNTYSSLLTLSFLCLTTAIYCNGSPYNIKQCTFTIDWNCSLDAKISFTVLHCSQTLNIVLILFLITLAWIYLCILKVLVWTQSQANHSVLGVWFFRKATVKNYRVERKMEWPMLWPWGKILECDVVWSWVRGKVWHVMIMVKVKCGAWYNWIKCRQWHGKILYEKWHCVT